MKDKKQITIISLLGALAVGVLASAVVLGNAYNNSQAQENKTEYAAVMESYEPDTISAEHETETEETSEAETEAEPETIAEETILKPNSKQSRKTPQKQMKPFRKSTRTKLRRKS